MYLKEGMNYEEIFKVLNDNGFKFGREYYDGEDRKYKFYNKLPNHGCWVYHPRRGFSIGFNPGIDVNEFIREFNLFVNYVKKQK
ncbi:MAG: hypothetical protein ACRDAG_01315 [Cetobacterium somerae]|uniref:hypothetical protein n=1 Tax=Cetobacterium TaxID=180162 RepID=UPI003EE59B24